MTFLNDKHAKDKTDIALKVQGKLEKNQTVAAEQFSQYFSTIADDIGGLKSRTLTEKECELHNSIMMISSRWEPNAFTFHRIKKTEALEALKMLNPNKGAGYDLLPPKVLKISADELSTPLTTIFNQAIEENVWPKAWKMDEWIPVFQKCN